MNKWNAISSRQQDIPDMKQEDDTANDLKVMNVNSRGCVQKRGIWRKNIDEKAKIFNEIKL